MDNATTSEIGAGSVELVDYALDPAGVILPKNRFQDFVNEMRSRFVAVDYYILPDGRHAEVQYEDCLSCLRFFEVRVLLV